MMSHTSWSVTEAAKEEDIWSAILDKWTIFCPISFRSFWRPSNIGMESTSQTASLPPTGVAPGIKPQCRVLSRAGLMGGVKELAGKKWNYHVRKCSLQAIKT